MQHTRGLALGEGHPGEAAGGGCPGDHRQESAAGAGVLEERSWRSMRQESTA